MKRGFSGEHIPLFDSMLIHDQPGQDKGATLPIESQHTPIASLTTSQPTTSQPMSSQEQPSQVLKTEPIITTSSPLLYETTIPHTTSSMPHDSPLSGGDTPESDKGSKKLNELMELCTKLFDKVTSLEKDLKQTKKVYDDEEDLVLEDPSNQGRMTEIEYEDIDVETEYEEVEYELDQTTPTKVSQGKEQSLESFEVQLDVLSAAKILADASRERVKTYKSYTRRRRSTVSLRDSTAGGLFSTAKKILSTDERIAHKLNEEEMAKAVAREEQERIDFEKALEKYSRETTKYYKKISNTQEETSLSSSSKEEFDDLLEEYDWIQDGLLQRRYELKRQRQRELHKRHYFKRVLKSLRTTEASRSEPIQEQPTEEPKELSKEKLKKMLEIIPVEEIKRLYDTCGVLTWRRYDICGVHHVSSTRGHDIYMLTEKDYPLTTAVMGLMLSRRLQVEEDSEMARDLVIKIFIEANKPRS
ncbi:hypothetical protein Tco_0191201 [Tanacetum coccineum]